MTDQTKTQTKSTKELNLLQRVLLTRFELSQANLKKTGYNQHLKYKYFELDDFLPKLVELTNKNGVATMFNIHADFAILKLVNVDNTEDTWDFTVQVAESKVQGGSAIQNLGSQITYLRRYLLMMAFEIAEVSAEEREANDTDGKELTEDEIKQINECETLEKLNVICKEMIADKGVEYKKVITRHYADRKAELGGAK